MAVLTLVVHGKQFVVAIVPRLNSRAFVAGDIVVVRDTGSPEINLETARLMAERAVQSANSWCSS